MKNYMLLLITFGLLASYYTAYTITYNAFENRIGKKR